MKKGICLTAVFPEAMFDKDKLIQAIQLTAQTNFYDGVEYYFDGSEADCKEIRDTIKELGLYSVFLAGYLMKSEKTDISSRDEAVRKSSVTFSKELIKRAICLGADKVLVLSGPVWADEDREQVIQQSVKSIRKLSDARNYETAVPEISLEFFNDQGEPYLALGDFETIKLLCEELTGANFGITYDLSHAAQLGWNIRSTFVELLPWIHHIHIANSVSRVKDSPLYGDKHPLFGVKDEDLSLVEVQGLLQEFRQNGDYENVSICSMEMISRDDHSVAWYFEQTLNQAKILLTDL